jgi:hypothetical protein
VPLELSFGQVEAVCAALNRIASDKRVAFAGRLKQLQKHGIMEERRRPGRGKAGTYDFGDLMRFVVAVELVQAGLMPQMAARLVACNWSSIQHVAFAATYTGEEMEEWQEMPFGPNTDDWYWMLTPEALRDMTEERLSKFDHYEGMMSVPVDELSQRLQEDREIGVLGEGWRMIVLHGTKISKAVVFLVEEQFRYASREQMRAEIQAEFDDFSQILRDDPLEGGIEEVAIKRFRDQAQGVLAAMQREDIRARYHPSQNVLDRHANRVISKYRPHLLAYLKAEQFDGQTTPDIRATNDLMSGGLIVPEMRDGEMVFVPSPLGRTVQARLAAVNLPPHAIEDWRREEEAKISAGVQRKIDRILASDPDNQKDYYALERWARHGGETPFSETKRKEIAERFVGRVHEELKDDPESFEEFGSSLERAAKNGDDQEA